VPPQSSASVQITRTRGLIRSPLRYKHGSHNAGHRSSVVAGRRPHAKHVRDMFSCSHLSKIVVRGRGRSAPTRTLKPCFLRIIKPHRPTFSDLQRGPRVAVRGAPRLRLAIGQRTKKRPAGRDVGR
jgi:hypothetical protein